MSDVTMSTAGTADVVETPEGITLRIAMLKGETLYAEVRKYFPSFSWTTDAAGRVRFTGYPLHQKKGILRQPPLRRLLVDKRLRGAGELITDPQQLTNIRAEGESRRRAAKSTRRSCRDYE